MYRTSEQMAPLAAGISLQDPNRQAGSTDMEPLHYHTRCS